MEVPLADADPANLFFALDTQWHRHAMTGQRTGIDYAAIRPTAELLGIEPTPELLADLRRMEMAALAQFGAKAGSARR
ncbi:DUF1799 domain-containing protein [Alteriqipengyuania flavescens]|nr:DUF1799 domain-containing protein [Alteriqipengyuania flavescens]WJY26047.1 DUF1799 domain-containing protein [Alteriqipengyuania flavescens]